MTSLIENKITMQKTTLGYLNEHESELSALPMLAEKCVEFGQALETIDTMIEKFSGNPGGVMAVKRGLRKDLTTCTLDISAKTEAFFIIREDLQLRTEVHCTKSDLQRFSDGSLLGFAEMLMTTVKKYRADLTGFDIKDEDILEFDKLICRFRDTRIDPRKALNNRARMRQVLNEWIEKGDKTLEDIDAIMCMIRLKRPDLYQGYLSARKIVKTGRTKIQLTGRVVESNTQLPLSGAKITLTQCGNGNKPFKQLRSATKGHFRLHSLPAGDYDYLATRPGYQSVSGVIHVIEREGVKLELALEKAL